MAKRWITLILSSMMLIAMPLVHGIDQDPLAVEEWFKNLPSMTQKQTHLHFYLRDLVSGASPTAMRVAQSSITASPTVMELGIAPSRLLCPKKNNRNKLQAPDKLVSATPNITKPVQLPISSGNGPSMFFFPPALITWRCFSSPMELGILPPS
ncbi:hypothetical protein L1887_16728 [Cichorium endivia]|nr:hypothetical protein L1887_16728 [Cichorium endivia]